MTLRIVCPDCSQSYRVRSDYVDRQMTCKKCGSGFRITPEASPGRVKEVEAYGLKTKVDENKQAHTRPLGSGAKPVGDSDRASLPVRSRRTRRGRRRQPGYTDQDESTDSAHDQRQKNAHESIASAFWGVVAITILVVCAIALIRLVKTEPAPVDPETVALRSRWKQVIKDGAVKKRFSATTRNGEEVVISGYAAYADEQVRKNTEMLKRDIPWSTLIPIVDRKPQPASLKQILGPDWEARFTSRLPPLVESVFKKEGNLTERANRILVAAGILDMYVGKIREVFWEDTIIRAGQGHSVPETDFQLAEELASHSLIRQIKRKLKEQEDNK